MSRILQGESFYDRYGVDPTGLALWLDQSDARSYGDNSIWYDLSGNGNHGKQATASYQPAIIGAGGLAGMARQFDGVDDYIDCGSHQSLNIIDPFTVEVVLRMTTSTGGYLIDNRYSNGFLVWVSSGGRVTMSIRDVAESPIDISLESINVVNDGFWHFCVCKRSGDYASIGIDSVVDCSSDGWAAYDALDASRVCIIGDRSWTRPYNPFEGSIGILRIWSRALSAAEIQRLYLVDAPKFGKL